MKKDTISFREIEREDYKSLEKIISDTWNYQQFCSSLISMRLSKLYLASCLANQTFNCVAVNNGEPVGIIMGKSEKNYHSTISYEFRKIMAVLNMLKTKEGREVLKMFAGFDKLDRELLSQSQQTFGGEVAFFAVRSDQRGTGVGKELWSRLQVYMKSKGIKKFYLYTDSTCNFGFYEHQGMVRICEQQHSLKPHLNEDILFFLYEYNLESGEFGNE